MFHSEELAADQIEALRAELESRIPPSSRWNASPEDVRRSVLKLVLTLIEFVRGLLERQTLHRMERETLTEDEIEQIGLALMKLEQTIQELAAQFEIDPRELQLDLGPLGRLL